MNILFLDIDGVLHRGNSYLADGRMVSKTSEAIALFEYASELDALLNDYPDVSIVWSSDWAWHLGLAYTTDCLPSARLRQKIIGATYDGTAIDRRIWPTLPRGEQVLDFVRRYKLTNWLAVDDRSDGFEGCRDHLVQCQTEHGLGDAGVMAILKQQCKMHFR